MNAHTPPPRWPMGERIQRILDEVEANPPATSRRLDVIAPDFRRFRVNALSAARDASDCELHRVTIAMHILTDQFAKLLDERRARKKRGQRKA